VILERIFIIRRGSIMMESRWCWAGARSQIHKRGTVQSREEVRTILDPARRRSVAAALTGRATARRISAQPRTNAMRHERPRPGNHGALAGGYLIARSSRAWPLAICLLFVPAMAVAKLSWPRRSARSGRNPKE